MTLVSALLALLLAAPFQQAGTQPAPANSPTASAEPFYGPSHVDLPVMHLAFDLPEGVLSRPDLAKQAATKFEEKAADGTLCLHLPVLAFDPKVIRRVYLYQYSAECFPEGQAQDRLRNTALALLHGQFRPIGKEAITSPMDYELGSHNAAVVSGNVYSENNHGILFGEAACMDVWQNMACWVFVSSTAPKVAKLATAPVTFEDGKPMAVIPEDASHFAALPTLTFHDEKLHVEFTYPGSFASAKPRADSVLAKKTEEATGRQKTTLGCMSLLLSADDLEEDHRSNLTIFTLDIACSGLNLNPKDAAKTMKEFGKGMDKGLQKLGKADLSKPVSYTIAGHAAAMVRGTLQLPSGTADVLVACTRVDTSVLCWQVFSTLHDVIPTVATAPVSFDGGLGVPLVPPSLLTQK